MAQLQEVFLFSPTQISGCQVWLDGADPNGTGVLPANGASVSTWVDKSGNARNATAFSTAATFSNSNVVFTGNQMYNTTLTSVLNKQTMFAIASANSTNKMDIVGVQTTTVTTGIQLIVQNYSQVVTLFGGTLVANGSAVTPNVRFMYGNIYNAGSDSFVYLNGTQSGTKSGSTTLTGSGTVTIGAYYYIGSDPTPNEWWIGNISEVIVYNNVLSTSQRQQIEGYLAWKWGLQGSLPSNHPYKTYRPIGSFPVVGIPPVPIRVQTTIPFNPTSITGCQLWVDAADPASMTFSSGSNLQRWANKATSSGIFTQAGTADRLTYTSSNGYPLVSFNSDGSTSNAWMTTSLSLTANTSFLQVITPITYTSGTWSFYWSWQWTSAGNRLPGLRSSNVNNDLQPYITWVGNNNNRIPITNGTSYLSFVEFTGGGANTRYSINGNTPSAGTIAASNVNSSVFILGGDGNAGATVWGKYYLSEMIMYSNVLTTSQREQIEGYLAWKWGLTTSLPNGHPYKRPAIAPFSFRSVPFNGSLNQWVPTQISGLTLWLDGADRSRLTLTGSAVTQWRDKSGQNNTYTNNGTITYSNQGLSFPGTAYMQNTSLTGFPFGSNPSISTFIVFAYTNANSTRGLFQYGNVTCSKTGYVVYVDNDVTLGNLVLGTLYCGDLNVNGRVTANTITMVSDIVTPTAVSGSLLRAGFINGSPMDNRPINSATGVNLTSSGSSRLGDAAGGYLLGTIYEVLFFNTSVSTAQRQQLEGYLAWKWSLQGNLPANHPYKKFPPAP